MNFFKNFVKYINKVLYNKEQRNCGQSWTNIMSSGFDGGLVNGIKEYEGKRRRCLKNDW